jgi:hypothetical protein
MDEFLDGIRLKAKQLRAELNSVLAQAIILWARLGETWNPTMKGTQFLDELEQWAEWAAECIKELKKRKEKHPDQFATPSRSEPAHPILVRDLLIIWDSISDEHKKVRPNKEKHFVCKGLEFIAQHEIGPSAVGKLVREARRTMGAPQKHSEKIGQPDCAPFTAVPVEECLSGDCWIPVYPCC